MLHHVRILGVRLLAVAVILAAGASLAAADPPPPGRLVVDPAENSGSEIVLRWTGRVASPMASQIRTAFETHRSRGDRVVFKIHSGGGSVSEGERVIALLREIRATHQLETVVEQGQICGSMCVFIYLQGDRRVAALSSLWLFHEISHHDPKTHKILSLDRRAWESLVEKYFAPAGVSAAWTERMKPLTIESDYWQTGADLVRDKSGIFHLALGNQRERLIADRAPTKPEAGREPVKPAPSPEAPKAPAEEPKQPGSRHASMFETKACHALQPETQVYVNTPCG